MTPEDAKVAIAATCPWFQDKDLDALLSPDIAPEELADILAVYGDQGIPTTGSSSWSSILGILGVVGTVLGVILPGIGVVQGIIGLAKT